nr:hypothetical protein [Tanacetum cinerariifolium]
MQLICENSSTIDVCDNHSEILFDSNNDDLSSDDESFEDIEYVDASVLDPEIVSIEEENGVEEENVVQREEEEVDLEDISQVQDAVLRKKLFSITRLISNIESLNDNSTPDCVFNSFESNNSLLDNYLPEFKTFCDHSKETRSGIENFADDPEGDIRFLEELLIDNSILSHESFDSNFEENPSISRPPPEPPDNNFDLEPEDYPPMVEAFLCRIFVLVSKTFMAHPVQNINHSAFRSMFEREKLFGNNFNDWFRQLKLVFRVEKKMYVIEQPLPTAPATDSEANMLAEWNALYDAYNELKSMFEKQVRVERFDLIQTFHACKQEEGKPVAAYVLQMKGYINQLERLGYMLQQDIIVGLILNGVTKHFARFVRNYIMHNIGKTIDELHAILVEYEKGLPKKAETPQVMMIKGGKIKKYNKKTHKAKGKGKANGKGKDKPFYIPKPKNPKPAAKENPSKDDTCHHCKELTLLYTSQHNGVSERRYRTLLDIIRSMMDLTTLPLSFWDYALESATRILNMVPTKKVDKTPYELCCGSSVTPTPILDEIIALSGETEIPKVIKILFEQHIAEEKDFTKYIRDKITDVKASLRRVCTAIREMESKSDKDAWTNAIDCFKETKVRLELKLSCLTELEDENFDVVKELKVHYAIMDLCEED